jgi:hypothetical protein
MKNDLTTRIWQDDIWCPINIILLCTSDVINSAFVLRALVRSVRCCLCSPIFFQSAMNGMLKSMSHPNIAAPGDVLCTVCYVEQIAYATSDKKTSISLVFTNSAISSLYVRNMFPRTAWICSSKAFACGFLTPVGLRFIPHVSHLEQKWSLNSLPLLYIKYQQCGYLINQVIYTRLLICAELLSKVVSASLVFL